MAPEARLRRRLGCQKTERSLLMSGSIDEDADLVFTRPPGPAFDLPRPFVLMGQSARLVPSALETPRALILGYGLGAVAGILRAIRQNLSIQGVEISPALFREACSTRPDGVTLACEDALAFLSRSGPRYDLVVDDCFVREGDDVRRPDELQCHAALVRSRLTKGSGIYVRNLLWHPSASIEDQTVDLREQFECVRLKRMRDWDNVLAVASDHPIPNATWRAFGR